MNFTKNDLQALEKPYLTNLINSLPGYKCLQMVGTANHLGITNLGLFSSIFHVGANPALLGFVFRPDAPAHNTLANIKETGQYTFNNVLPTWFTQAHQTSARFANGVSEFEPCGFDKYYIDGFKAPFVKQASIKIGLEKREIINLAINNTTIVIGEITQILLANQLIESDGYVNHVKAGTVTVAGLDSYFLPENLARLTYAKVGEMPHKI